MSRPSCPDTTRTTLSEIAEWTIPRRSKNKDDSLNVRIARMPKSAFCSQLRNAQSSFSGIHPRGYEEYE